MVPSREQLELRVGHPGDKWQALQAGVQERNLKAFRQVQAQWLDLMWCLDAYRTAGVAPARMGDVHSEAKRLDAVYRGKGNWFATLISLLLENQTSLRLAPRTSVQGFSQFHQIDVAWPDRELDPLLCLETKVTGAPPGLSDPERRGMADWTNRRKELKFAATDLKLYRRQNLTEIRHWDVWRETASPRCYFLWAVRLSDRDRIDKIVSETQALVRTYLDGAGILAWRRSGDAYELVPIPQSDRVSEVDDVLYRVSTELMQMAGPDRLEPPPIRPPTGGLLAAEDSSGWGSDV